MYAYLLVALGGAIGSILRFWLTNVVSHASNSAFPWGTILVNVTGSLAIGVLAALAGASGRMTADGRALTMHLLIVGLCGGYTTFSSLQPADLHTAPIKAMARRMRQCRTLDQPLPDRNRGRLLVRLALQQARCRMSSDANETSRLALLPFRARGAPSERASPIVLLSFLTDSPSEGHLSCNTPTSAAPDAKSPASVSAR